MFSRPAQQALRGSIRELKNNPPGPGLSKARAFATNCRPQRQYLTSNPRASTLRLSQWERCSSSTARRCFSSSRDQKAQNKIYTSVRNPSELETYIQLSTSSRRPLITLWTASYCPSCKQVAPLISRALSSEIADPSKTINYCEVEFDSPDMMSSEMGMRYMITSLPTLVTFDRGELIEASRVSDVKKLGNENWLKEHFSKEAERRGGGTGGGGGGDGGLGAGLFSGLFGDRR